LDSGATTAIMLDGILGITKLEFYLQFGGSNISGLEVLVATSYGKNVMFVANYKLPK